MNVSAFPDYVIRLDGEVESAVQQKMFLSPVLGFRSAYRVHDKLDLNATLHFYRAGENSWYKDEQISGNRIKYEDWIKNTYDNLGIALYPGLAFKVGRFNFKAFAGYELDVAANGNFDGIHKITDYEDEFTPSELVTYTHASFNPFAYVSDSSVQATYKNADRINHQLIGGLELFLFNRFNIAFKVSSGNYYDYFFRPLPDQQIATTSLSGIRYNRMNFSAQMFYHF